MAAIFHRGARAALVCLALGSLGCFTMPPAPRDATQATLEAYVRSFLRAEPILLESLSRSDPRFAKRLGIAAPARFTDPFMFDVRAIGLENVLLELARVTLPEWKGDEPRVLAEHRLEEELLYRLVLEEQFRLTHERDDVHAAAGLLRAIAGAWSARQIASDERAREVDGVLAWRLAQVRGAMQPFVLSEAERAELAEAVEALDALATMSAKLPKSRVEIVRLRAQIAVTWAAPYPVEEWDDVATSLHAFLGIGGDYDRLLARIDAAADALRTQASVGLAVIAPAHRADVMRRAAAAVHAETHCRGAADGSVVRSLAPPPERAPACAAVAMTAAAESDLDELVALVALHDAAIVGAWAIAMHGKTREPARAIERWPTMSPIGAERRARLVRLAQVHPSEAIGAAIAAAILVRDGAAKTIATARAWRAFGEAPLDVVERELFEAPRRRVPRKPATNDLAAEPR